MNILFTPLNADSSFMGSALPPMWYPPIEKETTPSVAPQQFKHGDLCPFCKGNRGCWRWNHDGDVVFICNDCAEIVDY
jgi:hypothetical protein